MVPAFFCACLLWGSVTEISPSASPESSSEIAESNVNGKGEPTLAAPDELVRDLDRLRQNLPRIVPTVSERSALTKNRAADSSDDAEPVSDPFAARDPGNAAGISAEDMPPKSAEPPNLSGPEMEPRASLPPAQFPPPQSPPPTNPSQDPFGQPANTPSTEPLADFQPAMAPRRPESGDEPLRPPVLNEDALSRPLEPAGLVRRAGGEIEATGELPPPRELGELVPVRHENTSAAQNLVEELYSDGPQEPTTSGSPPPANIALKDVLQRGTSPAERLALVQSYWRLATLAAESRVIARHAQRMEALSALYRQSGNGDVPLELSASVATAIARQQEVEVHWAETSARLSAGSAQAPIQLRPGDLPHAGTYRTEFDRMFGGRPAPPRLQLLNRLLPLRQQAVASRATAIAAAANAVSAADESFQRGELSLGRLLFQLRRHAEEQLRFLLAVETYNNEIAEYALTATGGQLPLATLAETLVKAPQDALLSPVENTVSAAPLTGTPRASFPPGTPVPSAPLPGGTIVPMGTPFPMGNQRTYGVNNAPSTGTTIPLGGSVPASQSGIYRSPTSSGSPTPAIDSAPGDNLPAMPQPIQGADHLPGHSILKSISTLPPERGGSTSNRAVPVSGFQEIPAGNSTLQPIAPPSGRIDMASPLSRPPARFQQIEQPQLLPPPPASATVPAYQPPGTVPTGEGSPGPSPGVTLPATSAPPATAPPAAPTDRSTLRPISPPSEQNPLRGVRAIASMPQGEQLEALRDAFYRHLPPGATSTTEIYILGMWSGEPALRYCNWVEQMAAERIWFDQIERLAALETATLQLRNRQAGDYSLLAIRAARSSTQASFDTARSDTIVAEAMVDPSQHPAADAVALPDLRGVREQLQPGTRSAMFAKAVILGGEAVIQTHLAAEQALVDVQTNRVSVEDAIDTLDLQRRASLQWLASVTRQQVAGYR